jgi:hypothetical protein
MGLRTAMAMTILALVAAGCASRPDYPTFDLNPYQQRAIRSADHFEAAPLFDAQPGRWSAEAFSRRSDWPSTAAYYSPGEVTEYRLYQVDHHGHGFYNDGHTHRWAQTRRYSISYR